MKTVSGGAIVLEFNNREGPLANKAVRQAIAYGIDRSYIADVLHAGYSKAAAGPLPFTNIFFNPGIEGYPYDLDKANALLDEAGYPVKDDGIRFELGLIYIAQPFWPDYQSVPGEYVAQALKKIGVKVNQEPMAGAAAWSKRISAWNYDMSLNWPGDKVDPAIGVSRLYVCDNVKNQAYTNTSGYCNAEVDGIFAQAALIVAIGITTWTTEARLARAEFLKIKEREYVTAERAVGATDRRLILQVILPNALPPLIIAVTLRVGISVIYEAALSFLGLTDPDVMTWGKMIGLSRDFFFEAWWTVTFPGVAILLTVLCIALIGDGLNDAFNPKLRGR